MKLRVERTIHKLDRKPKVNLYDVDGFLVASAVEKREGFWQGYIDLPCGRSRVYGASQDAVVQRVNQSWARVHLNS